MFKKIQTFVLVMTIASVTVIFSTGCNNIVKYISGESNRQPVLESENGSTITITHNDPQKVISGSFTIHIVAADKRGLSFSTGHGTWKDDKNGCVFSLTSPSGVSVQCTYSLTYTYRYNEDDDNDAMSFFGGVTLKINDTVEIHFGDKFEWL